MWCLDTSFQERNANIAAVKRDVAVLVGGPFLDRDLPQIEPAVFRIFDRAQDAALFLPSEQRAGTTGEKLQQRCVSRV
jgi:hypothetical protein